MPIREFPLDDPRTWESLATEAHGFALVASASGVFSRALIEQLRREVQDGQAVVVTQAPSGREMRADIRGVRVKVRADRLTAFAPARFDDRAPRAAELIVVPASFMSAVGQAPLETDRLPIRRWLEWAAVEGRVRVVPSEPGGARWYQEVRTPGDVRAAEKKLFNSLKSDFEGFVDRYFNRRLSRWFTRLFLFLGLTPNSITLLATLVGLAAAVEFSAGTYESGVMAALLFQLAAVIDCCDGEVARLTFTESPFGAWLDIAMDNVVHMAIFAGIAAGAYSLRVGQDDAWVPLALGAAAVVGNGLSFGLVDKAQKIKTAGRWTTPVHAAWSDFMLKNVASRDFSIIVLAFALSGKLDWFLWLAAAGSLVFALVMLWVVRPSATTRTVS
jgi:phosphatidylglycerophosphate synthase